MRVPCTLSREVRLPVTSSVRHTVHSRGQRGFNRAAQPEYLTFSWWHFGHVISKRPMRAHILYLGDAYSRPGTSRRGIRSDLAGTATGSSGRRSRRAGRPLVDLDRHPEELDPATLLLLLGERAYEGDRARELEVGVGLHPDRDLLVALDLVDVGLAHLGVDDHLRDVGQDEERLVRPDLVAHLGLALLGAEEHILVDQDPRHVRPHLAARELLLGEGELGARLLDPALRGGDGRLLLGDAVGGRGLRSEEHTSELQSPCN